MEMLCRHAVLLGKKQRLAIPAGRSPKRRPEFCAPRSHERATLFLNRERKIMEHPQLPYNDDDKVSYALYTHIHRRGNEKYTF